MFDTGHDLFHTPTPGGVSCATCHPEGRDDGSTFVFAEMGDRRTPALNVSLEGTEPFHWVGDLADMHALGEEVRVKRMQGPELTHQETDALARFVFDLPRENPKRAADELAVTRGETIFDAVGCRECHSGPSLTNNANVDIGGHVLQVPPLVGVAFRPPFMHDGRAADLHAAVQDMLPYSEPGGPLDADQRDDLVAYLESL